MATKTTVRNKDGCIVYHVHLVYKYMFESYYHCPQASRKMLQFLAVKKDLEAVHELHSITESPGK